MKFPKAFEERMKKTLGADYEAFERAYDNPPRTGLRVNTLKMTPEAFVKQFPYTLRPVPWASDGFYYDAEETVNGKTVTKHPYYYAGLYYIQEPSAMAPVAALAPPAGGVCLDLCAAPGGKSTQIASAIHDDGVLISNDISEKRIKAVLRNVEKFGLRNAIVLNDSPERIAKNLEGLVDALLIDAPCSGEGMFKKDAKAMKSWERYGPPACHDLQREILDASAEVVKSGGKLVYSTCTFAPEENEMQAEYIEDTLHFSPNAIELGVIAVEGNRARIWPHRHEGEGHFLGSFVRQEEGEQPGKPVPYGENQPPESVREFIETHLKSDRLKGFYEVDHDRVFLRPKYRLPLKGLKVIREGLLVGHLKNDRFVPSQALAIYLKREDFEPILDLPSDGEAIDRYLKCETLQVETETEGLHLVCTDGFPVGWAKINGGMLKNLYPASWRIL